ncbi:MAG: ABC transporter substrate-binding protein [Myxococcaceae bacterium]
MVLVWTANAAALPRSSFIGPPVKKVKRVVTLAPSLTDIVLAVGAGESLVGVSRFDEDERVAKVARVGGFSDPSVEAVISLKPDLMIVQPGPGNRVAVEKIAELGVPVLLLPLQDVAGVLEALRVVGKVLGKSEQGDALAKNLEDTRTTVRSKAISGKRVRVLFVYGFDPMVVAGPGSFANELLEDAGGENVVKPPFGAYVTFSPETAITSKPEVVVNAADPDTGIDQFRSLPGLREARWLKVSGKELLFPGPRLAKGLEDLYALLHPSTVTK